MQTLSVGELLAFQWATNLTRYAIVAGGAWLVFWKWFYPKFESRMLYDRRPDRAQIRREVKYSLLSMTIFLVPVFIVNLTSNYGWNKVYLDIHEHSWGWYVASLAILFFWHDTYFYWAHRALHWGPFYKFHRTHHLSREPTPFTAYAFHPVEALIESLPVTLALFVIPIHYSAIMLFVGFSIAFNVYGHLGIKLFSHAKSPWKYWNSPESHGWHHQYYRGNYSLYTDIWDRIMGTKHEGGAPRGTKRETAKACSPSTPAPVAASRSRLPDSGSANSA